MNTRYATNEKGPPVLGVPIIDGPGGGSSENFVGRDLAI
jgi:hypothetical protein